jgi:hypothetical protein
MGFSLHSTQFSLRSCFHSSFSPGPQVMASRPPLARRAHFSLSTLIAFDNSEVPVRIPYVSSHYYLKCSHSFQQRAFLLGLFSSACILAAPTKAGAVTEGRAVGFLHSACCCVSITLKATFCQAALTVQLPSSPCRFGSTAHVRRFPSTSPPPRASAFEIAQAKHPLHTNASIGPCLLHLRQSARYIPLTGSVPLPTVFLPPPARRAP